MSIKRKKTTIIGLLLAMTVIGGCGKKTAEEDNLIFVEKEAEETEYGITLVTRQDLEETVTVRCQYQAVHSEDLSFSQDGKVIQEVYVKEGDKVVKGQLLAALTKEELEEQITELEYSIARNEILLNQVLEKKALDIAIENSEYEYNYRTYMDYEPHKERLQNIEDSYQYTIEDYEDALLIDRLRLQQLQAEIEDGKLYAGMNGTVVYMKPKMEGTLTVEGERVFTITDSDECLFIADRADAAVYFTQGTPVMLEIATGGSVGTYEVLPYELDKAQEKGLRFALTDDQISQIDVGSRGNIVIVLQSREDVLCVSPKALHSVDGKYYVYILKEDNSQETRWVEYGLWTKDYVEIVSGLEEGDKVVLR